VETIGIVAVCVNDYGPFLTPWANAVASLTVKPSQVTVITDATDTAAAREALPNLNLIQPTRTWQHHPQVLVNDAIAETSTDWICKMDIDDLIYPHALNHLNNHPTDVLCFGIQHGERSLPARPVTGGLVLFAPHNLVNSGSPYRRWVWEAGHYRDMIFEDWAFWIDAAANAAKFAPSSTIDYEYAIHGSQVSENCDTALWEQRIKEIKCALA